MRTIVTRYAGNMLREPPNQRRAKSLFAPDVPPMPTPAPPPAMPDPNSPATLAAQKRSLNQAMSSGRASTQLTTARAGDTIAGGYSANKLGSAS